MHQELVEYVFEERSGLLSEDVDSFSIPPYVA